MPEKEDKKTKNTKVKAEKEEVKEETPESPVKDEEEVKEQKKVSMEVEEAEEKKDPETESEDIATTQDEELQEDTEEEPTNDRFAHATVYADDASAITIEKRFSFKRLLLFVSIVCLSAAIFFGAMLFYQKNSGNMSFDFDFKVDSLLSFMKPTPTPTQAPKATPTPEPEITLSEYSLQVLNGSGVSGAAGAVRDLLEEEGFEDVEAGNAEDQDFEDTQVQMKENVPSQIFDTIAKALPEYTVIEGDDLDEDYDYDIVVTVGQKTETEEDEEE